MTPTKPLNLALLSVVAAAVAYAMLHLLATRGVHLAPVPYLVAVVELFLAGVVFAAGWTVRAYLRGDKPELSGLRAMRFVVLGKATSHAGVVLFGWYAAQAILAATQLQFEPQRARALSAGLAAVGALVLIVAGYVTERFGRIPPSDGGDSVGESDGPSGQSA